MQDENITLATVIRNLVQIVLAALLPLYVISAMWTHSLAPGAGELRERPDGYQSIRGYRPTRTRDFPALHDQPPPGPVAGSGHLASVEDTRLWSITPGSTPPGTAPKVKTLRIRRPFGVSIIAHLDVPLRPSLQEHLRTLRKGAVVTVAGIGHGDGRHNVYIYPVHQVNGHAP